MGGGVVEVQKHADFVGDDKHFQTCQALTKDPRKVLRGLGDTITSLKAMHMESGTNKYCGQLHEDIAKLLPKFAGNFKAVEALVLSSPKGQ